MNSPDQIYFSGDYADWSQATRDCTYPETGQTLTKVLEASVKIRENQTIEKGVFRGRVPNFALLTTLLSAAIREGNRLNVLDFGGALGISYFHSRPFLGHLLNQWSIVELPELVAEGKKHFQSETLNFYESIESCLKDCTPSIVVLSGVLQCLPDPWGVLRELLKIKAPYVFIDRTALIESDADRLTVQHVPEWIYLVDFPAWFLSVSKFRATIAAAGYECLCDFPAIDKYSLPGAHVSFKGFICRLPDSTAV